MTQTVEVRLKIPSLRAQREGSDAPSKISNDDVRFIKQVAFDGIPRAGEVLTMTIGSAATFQCEVVRSEWHDDKNMFVIACRYAKRTITEAEYRALMGAPDWHVTPVL
jgi:hypothetical protein